MSVRLLSLLLVVFTMSAVFAQDAPELTEADGWRSTALLNLSGTQVAFSNWQAGGINTLAATANFGGTAERVLGKTKQIHAAKVGLGAIRQSDQDMRKAIDEVRYNFDLQYLGTGHWRPTFAVEARTQALLGFEFDSTKALSAAIPTRDPDSRRRTSAFFAPGYLTQVLGVTYDRGSFYSLRLGIGLKETVVRIEELRPLYGNDLDQGVRVEGGPDLLLLTKVNVAKNVVWNSRLNAFYSVQALDQAPDTIWENQVQMKVNDWLSAYADLTLLFDADQSNDLQVRQGFGVGLAFSLL